MRILDNLASEEALRGRVALDGGEAGHAVRTLVDKQDESARGATHQVEPVDSFNFKCLHGCVDEQRYGDLVHVGTGRFPATRCVIGKVIVPGELRV